MLYIEMYILYLLLLAHIGHQSTPSPAIVVLLLAIGVHVVLTLANDGAASKTTTNAGH